VERYMAYSRAMRGGGVVALAEGSGAAGAEVVVFAAGIRGAEAVEKTEESMRKSMVRIVGRSLMGVVEKSRSWGSIWREATTSEVGIVSRTKLIGSMWDRKMILLADMF
jgi:hypothetical protein